MKILIHGIQYLSRSDAVKSSGPARWSLLCSAETTSLGKRRFGGKIIRCITSKGSEYCCNHPPTLRRPSWSMNGCNVFTELFAETSLCFTNSSNSWAYEICCTIFIQQVRALSRSCVERMVVCLLALGCRQMSMNRLKYAITRISLFNLENPCVMSSWLYTSATRTFLNSRLSVGVLTSVRGQLVGSGQNHCSPTMVWMMIIT